MDSWQEDSFDGFLEKGDVFEKGQILFYSHVKKNGYLSNFFFAPVLIDGKVYDTNEHYFQSKKFLDLELSEKVRNSITPMDAARLGRRKTMPLRGDWEYVKDNLMRKAVYQKFSQYENLRDQLLNTAGYQLIENSARDSYWGSGPDDNGKNMLGTILMETRTLLENQFPRSFQIFGNGLGMRWVPSYVVDDWNVYIQTVVRYFKMSRLAKNLIVPVVQHSHEKAFIQTLDTVLEKSNLHIMNFTSAQKRFDSFNHENVPLTRRDLLVRNGYRSARCSKFPGSAICNYCGDMVDPLMDRDGKIQSDHERRSRCPYGIVLYSVKWC